MVERIQSSLLAALTAVVSWLETSPATAMVIGGVAALASFRASRGPWILPDVAFGGLPFEHAAVARSRVHEIAGIQVRLPRVEDLIVMKAVAGRPKDLQDIEGLLAAHADLDLEEVRRWVREFSTAMTMPELIEDLDRLIARRFRGNIP